MLVANRPVRNVGYWDCESDSRRNNMADLAPTMSDSTSMDEIRRDWKPTEPVICKDATVDMVEEGG